MFVRLGINLISELFPVIFIVFVSVIHMVQQVCFGAYLLVSQQVFQKTEDKNFKKLTIFVCSMNCTKCVIFVATSK